MDVAISDLDRCINTLTLPKDSFESLSFCGATKEELRDYLADLPHNSPAELCNRLYKLLPEVAGLNVPPGRKLTLLDMAEPEAIECVQRLTKKLRVTPATTKVLSLSIAMLRYLAQGYKAVLVTSLKFPSSPPNLLIGAAYGAINALTQALAICWECYIPLPKNIWLELHSLYRIARIKNLESVNIRSQVVTTDVAATIKGAYVKPLLMACTDPSRHTPQDIRNILSFLTTRANLVEFVDNLKDGIFVVDPNSDKGPQYNFKIQGTTNRHFRLRTYRLVRHIEEQLATGTLTGLPPRLARDLCKYWSSEIKRQSDHIYEDKHLSLILGLGHIHRELTGCKSIEDYLLKLRGEDSIKPKLTLADIPQEEARGTFLARGSADKLMAGSDKAIDFHSPKEEETSKVRRYSGIRINHSDTGACVEFGPSSEHLTPGELIGLQQEHSAQWSIGVVRWVRITATLKRRIGIQLYKQKLAPCIISQITAESAGEPQYYPCLLLKNATEAKEDKVVVPALPFKPYVSASLHTEKGRQNIKLLSCLEETYHVGLYGLDYLQSTRA